MGMLRASKIQEGLILNKWIHNRMILHNKNVLIATTGATGSGKSYQDLRKAELWYQYYFKTKFPSENICFSVGEIMKRISSGQLRKGDLLILEEAGVNVGSLDFQNRISKVFTYVLQSFRSLNIGILFNVPYLSMLNKSARLLIHAHFITCGIDFKKGVSQSKGYFRQVNQTTGKVYPKYLRIKLNKKTMTVKRYDYSMPSEDLSRAYEAKKLKFVTTLTSDFSAELDMIEKEQIRKMSRQELSKVEQEAFDDWVEGLTIQQSADKRQKACSSIFAARERCRNKGYSHEKSKITLENTIFQTKKVISEAF